ncbi:MAG: SDR family NAD(P)-dependent oxidoreductase [Polyangiaceae bacterium]|jgi:NAD(P)-dependent dehydrogenase (short-subunit alcohol dehydrogenase family)/GNAT superfamily N-acetyltransferase|nr:SDR family NAD(P)-dependent oxidoreductase [Polyangiaceae bacterium]
MRIRPARPSEAATLSALALRSKAHWGYDQEFLERCRAELTLRPDDLQARRASVAELDGQIAGFVTIEGDPPFGEIGALFIEPALMGVGAGQALWLHAVEAARAAGFALLSIDSDPGAEGFYLRMGARRVGESPSASIPGRMLPCLVYEVAGPAAPPSGAASPFDETPPFGTKGTATAAIAALTLRAPAPAMLTLRAAAPAAAGPFAIAADDLRRCTAVLEAIVADRGLLALLTKDEQIALLNAAGRVASPDRDEKSRLGKAMRRAEKADKRARDRSARAATEIRALRREAVFAAPPPRPASLAVAGEMAVAGVASAPGEAAAGAGPASEATRSALGAESGQGRESGAESRPAGASDAASGPAGASGAASGPAGASGAASGPAGASGAASGPAGASGAAEAAETERRLELPRNCYVCKAEFRRLHFFYDSLCYECAEFNYVKRFQTARLDGKVALITGARLKIGYQASLMLLRAGARVVATTRFPHDAARRYAAEADFASFADRLQIYGLDLRHAPSVELFARHVAEEYERLDVLINNAAQTVRRPPGFYGHLLDAEARRPDELDPALRPLLAGHARCLTGLGEASGAAAALAPSWRGAGAGLGLLSSAALSQVPYALEDEGDTRALFPAGRLDADQQQVDLRNVNTWRLSLAEVPTAEMLEVHLVNAVAPFILCGKLKPLMLRDRAEPGHIVNVSAMEGSFSRGTKTDKHPHTNMAKAALNMMTLTSAPDYAKSNIYMNAVDTGWVTDEDPAAHAERKRNELDFEPPLDIVDGAARICDPIFSTERSRQFVWGKFFKDYRPARW